MVCRTLTHLTIFAGSVAGSALMFLSAPDRLDAALAESPAAEVAEAAAEPAEAPGADFDDIEATRRDLDRQVAVMAERIQTKELLIRDLVDGKTTLREVAEKFHKMNAEFPACMSVIRARYPDVPDEERMARNVLEFVHLQDMPAAELKAVETRLGAEFYQAFGHKQQVAATH
jgi:hypothetical protein